MDDWTEVEADDLQDRRIQLRDGRTGTIVLIVRWCRLSSTGPHSHTPWTAWVQLDGRDDPIKIRKPDADWEVLEKVEEIEPIPLPLCIDLRGAWIEYLDDEYKHVVELTKSPLLQISSKKQACVPTAPVWKVAKTDRQQRLGSLQDGRPETAALAFQIVFHTANYHTERGSLDHGPGSRLQCLRPNRRPPPGTGGHCRR